MRRGGKIVMEGMVLKIDGTKKPKFIDAKVTDGENKGKTILGIYEHAGETLRVCVALPGNDERPTDFSAKTGSSRALTVYKRDKK